MLVGSVWRALLILVVLIAAAGDARADRWFDIVTGEGARLGYASREETATEGGRTITDRQQYYLREQNSRSTRVSSVIVRREDASGRTTEIRETTDTNGFTSETHALIAEGRAQITLETRSGRWSQAIPLTGDVRFDGGEALFRAWDPHAAPRLEFNAFNMDALGVERVVVEASERGADSQINAIRRRFDGDQLRGVSRIVLDREGRVVEAAQPVFGQTIWFRRGERDAVMQPHSPYAVVPNSMIRSPVRITMEARRGHIRYRFSYRDGLEFAPPVTGEQRQARDGDALIVDICESCGPGLADDPAALAEALRPTAWLQSDHPRLTAIAGPIARLDVSDQRKMEMLITRAQRYLGDLDFNGHYSALDTITRRAGDCTEAAVLLAALGRGAGIPTRVVSGLAYSRENYHGVSNAFMPHSWTLAYVDGQWRSFDLALGAFDSTHIALTIGDGDARSIAAAGQLASLLVFDGLAEVRVRR
jgi:hypothetical protein